MVRIWEGGNIQMYFFLELEFYSLACHRKFFQCILMNLGPSSQILVAKCLVLNNTQHLTSDIIKWHHIQSRLDFTSFLALF